jgi:excisionase family DNA binding protein
MAQLVTPASRGPNEKLTIAEVCRELKVSRSTFYDWRAKRRAPPCITLPNGSLRVRRADLDRWLRAHEDAA